MLEHPEPLPEDAPDRAAALLAPALPAPSRVAGLLLLGERRPTLAWVLDVPDALVAAALAVRAAVPARCPTATGRAGCRT